MFEKTALGLHETKRCRLSEISHLRVDERRIFSGRPWVAVDYKGKRKFIGAQLIAPVPQGLLEPIYARFPNLHLIWGTSNIKQYPGRFIPQNQNIFQQPSQNINSNTFQFRLASAPDFA
ncbi:MAG TPA: hypothetical protein VKT33_11540 [Candidatus Angelobacter sp.]|nr:hypothetical protein [Candidatus Angelobacter sp.]